MKQGEGIIRDNCELLTNGRGGGMDGVQLVFIVRHQRSVAKAARHWEVLQVGRFFPHFSTCMPNLEPDINGFEPYDTVISKNGLNGGGITF